jgi:hypothetical protein
MIETKFPPADDVYPLDTKEVLNPKFQCIGFHVRPASIVAAKF